MSSPFIFSHEHAPIASNSARAVHLRRLFDIMELSIQREDTKRAHRAFAILARCPEVKWKAMWRLAILLISKNTQRPGAVVEFLETLDLPAQESRLYTFLETSRILTWLRFSERADASGNCSGSDCARKLRCSAGEA